MSKKLEIIALVPGSSGWEIWQGTPAAGLSRQNIADVSRAGELQDLPNLSIALFFPVKDATVLPFRAASADESLFADLAQMHCERMGIRTDPNAGQLVDSFVIEKSADSAVLATVALRTPQDGDLPQRSPKEFDYSPRAFAFAGNGIATWKEFSYWVFAFYQSGKMLYAQSSSNDSEHPNEDLLRDIKLAITQLSFQGIKIQIDELQIWHPAGELGEAGNLAHGLTENVRITRRPDPTIAHTPSKLLPADVQSLRRHAARRKQIIAISSAAAIALLSAIGYAGWELWKLKQKADKISLAAKEKAPIIEEFANHKSKWEELGPVVDSQQWPVEILFSISKCIPAVGGMRLTEARITNAEVEIKGQAKESGHATTFRQKVINTDELSRRFTFDPVIPNNTPKGWVFELKGAVPKNTP